MKGQIENHDVQPIARFLDRTVLESEGELWRFGLMKSACCAFFNIQYWNGTLLDKILVDQVMTIGITI